MLSLFPKRWIDSHTVVAGVGLCGPLLSSHFRLEVFLSPKEQLKSRTDLKPLLPSKPLRNLPVCRQLDSRGEWGVPGRAAKGSEVPYYKSSSLEAEPPPVLSPLCHLTKGLFLYWQPY